MDRLITSSEKNNSSTFKVTTLFGQVTGLVSFILGFILFVLGLNGSFNLGVIIESNIISARLTNASPGAILIISGLFIIWRYKPKGSDITVIEHTREYYNDFTKDKNTEFYQNVNKEEYPNISHNKNQVTSHPHSKNLPSYSFKLDNFSSGLPSITIPQQQKQPTPITF